MEIINPSSGGVTTVGAFNATSIANGASISGSTITFGPADATNPGMVVASGNQTFGGNYTFSSATGPTVQNINFTQSSRPQIAANAGHEGLLNYFGSTVAKWGSGGLGVITGNHFFPFTDNVSDLGFAGGSNNFRDCYLKRNLYLITSQTPASAGASGTTGMVQRDSDYIYVCVNTNTWKRAAISTW